MTYQTVNLGTAPTGAGGDTFRSTGAKINENFTNPSHAASRYVGGNAGNLMEVGFCGLGVNQAGTPAIESQKTLNNGFYGANALEGFPYGYGEMLVLNQTGWVHRLFFPALGNAVPHISSSINGDPWSTHGAFVVLNKNATIDGNGFIKAASPIVKLFADKIELNDEAAEQNITFEKANLGQYLIKGSSGFAKEGWWIEIPTDTHGNKICAVEYQTLENGDLEIKTFKKKMNEEGDIVANHDAPIDIPNNANGEPRWIDIRLNEIKKPVVITTLRTEKQPRMVQQIKYAPQLTYITKYEDLFDDEGKAVIVDGKNYQKPVTHIQTDQYGTPILTNQPVMNEKGEPLLEWVQVIDSEGKPVFDDVPVLDKDGNQIYDEVAHESE
ncbi:hypothetical protein [Acinetobacter pittii]|uniref:phage tail fiber protein n=1 Tax=Acinetobacter pittii TaxID=48296 RepID=UPI00192B5580|nr:hypothetical protein [Acinetobacter pittii]